jgi:hypothetical protein
MTCYRVTSGSIGLASRRIRNEEGTTGDPANFEFVGQHNASLPISSSINSSTLPHTAPPKIKMEWAFVGTLLSFVCGIVSVVLGTVLETKENGWIYVPWYIMVIVVSLPT